MKKPVKVVLWIVAIVIAIPVVFGIIGVVTHKGDTTITAATSDTTEETTAPVTVKSAWTYQSEKNEMDDSTTYLAFVEADEKLDFDFPYNGGATVVIAVWHSGDDNVAGLRITKGQFMPSSLDGKITVRFDSLPARTFHYSDPSDGGSDGICRALHGEERYHRGRTRPLSGCLFGGGRGSGHRGGTMNILREFSGRGTRPYPLDRERRRRVMVALAERDMTISGLARNLSIDQAIVSKVINGRRLSSKIEAQIAVYLERHEDYLFPKRTSEEIVQMRQAEAEAKRGEKAA